MLVFGIAGWVSSGMSWWWFALLLLTPDLFMAGYLGGTRAGAVVYNIGHSLAGPAALLGWAWIGGPTVALALGSVWLAHIGMDRMFGYGLKFGDSFKHTHLGWIGGAAEEDG